MSERIAGIVLAVLIHAAILLFGGIFFYTEKEKAALAPPKEVELFSEEKKTDEKADQKPEEKKDDQEEKHPQETVEIREEKPPDMRELFRGEEETPQGTDAVARLDAVSLSALASALEGGAEGGGDFSFGVSLASGGRIGGTGAPGETQEDRQNNGVFDVAELDQRARPVFQTPPVYPMSLRKQKIEATVHLVFTVDERGRVINPKVEKTTHEGFEDAALAAVRNWRFEPAVRGGEKVASKLRIPIRFSLSG